jgi:hypothetical protein
MGKVFSKKKKAKNNKIESKQENIKKIAEANLEPTIPSQKEVINPRRKFDDTPLPHHIMLHRILHF